MTNIIQRMNQLEIPLCLFFNRVNHYKPISKFFAVISRLGDGIIWYSIIIALPFIYGFDALKVSIHMALVGVVGLIIYKKMKLKTHRLRPYSINQDIFKNVAALDKFSFPSGHTLHAVGFSLVLISYYPELSFIVLPFAFLVALSRLVLGLHYPSDVLMGVLIGLSLALGSFSLIEALF